MPIIPPPPATDAMLACAQPSDEVLAFLNTRRSCPAPALSEPGPDRIELSKLLRLATRVPDHRRLAPWRFIIFDGAAQQQVGTVFAKRFLELHPQASADDLTRERRRFSCAPVVVAVISSPDPAHKTPVWEQELSAGALCYNLLLVANAAGWAGNWLSQWIAFDTKIASDLGLIANERVAGFIHLGTGQEPIRERPRPEIAPLISYWR